MRFVWRIGNHESRSHSIRFEVHGITEHYSKQFTCIPLQRGKVLIHGDRDGGRGEWMCIVVLAPFEEDCEEDVEIDY
jgi:hypothetical protein